MCVAPVALFGLDLVGGQDFAAREVDDGDLGLVGERERALSGVGVADAEGCIIPSPVQLPSRTAPSAAFEVTEVLNEPDVQVALSVTTCVPAETGESVTPNNSPASAAPERVVVPLASTGVESTNSPHCTAPLEQVTLEPGARPKTNRLPAVGRVTDVEACVTPELGGSAPEFTAVAVPYVGPAVPVLPVSP